MVNFKENEELKTLNHSCAHLMAQAIKHLYPQAKFWVGPVVAEGFYYDVDLGEDVIRDEDIEKIEKEMKKIAKSGKKIMRREVSKAEAMEMFQNDEYKLDLISDLEDGNITVYDQGDFTDLCRGPHVDYVKLCINFTLLDLSHPHPSAGDTCCCTFPALRGAVGPRETFRGSKGKRSQKNRKGHEPVYG